ncbi:hypothetical protein [Polaromonas jejuensis]
MPLVGDQLAEGFKGVIGAPLGQLCAADLTQQLANGLAQGQR